MATENLEFEVPYRLVKYYRTRCVNTSSGWKPTGQDRWRVVRGILLEDGRIGWDPIKQLEGATPREVLDKLPKRLPKDMGIVERSDHLPYTLEELRGEV